MAFLSSIAVRYPRISLALSVLVGAFFLAFIPSVQTIDNVDYFTVDGDQDYAFQQEIKRIFGDDEFFVIAFTCPDVFTFSNLGMLKDLAGRLVAHPGIRDVQSLGNVDYVDGGKEFFEVRKFLESIPEDRDGLEELRRQALGTPLYLDNLISRDGRTAALIVYPDTKQDIADFRVVLLSDVKRILKPFEDDGFVFHLAGNTVTNVSLSRYVQDDVARFIPLTYVLVAIVVWIAFRNIWITILSVINISVCVGATMGFMGIAGIAMHNVTAVVPSLVMALSLADTIHIFSCLSMEKYRQFQDSRKAIDSILQSVFIPCFLTTLTTAVGFLSLIVSSIPPIREFALAASVGMVFEFFFSFILLPPLLLMFRHDRIFRDKDGAALGKSVLSRFDNFVAKRNRSIFLLCFITVLVSVFYSGKIQVETNLVEYFHKKSVLRKDIDFIQDNLSGVSTLDISIKSSKIDDFKRPEMLLLIDQIQSFLISLPGVDASISFADYIKEMNKSFNDEDEEFYVIPENKALVAQYLLLYDSKNIDDYVNESFDHSRILVRLSETSSARQAVLIDSIKDYLETIGQAGLEMRVSGSVVQQVNVIEAVTDGLVSSLGLALVIIALIMFMIFGSIKLGLLSLIPNLFPLFLNFGLMGLLDIPLDTSTALISVVALGIAVDDTIHFLTEYNFQRKRGLSSQDSISQVFLNKGTAIITTSVILCFGFGVLVLSNFVPTFYFGLLSAVIMLTALAGDILLLPSIMHFGKK